MKKLFTLTMLLVLAMTASAQYRKSWDFTKWSAATIANLKADAAASSVTGWSDIEKKADAGEGKVAPEATAGKCFWLTDANGGELTANGEVIPELTGLNFNSTYSNNRSLAIAIDYPSTSIGTYAGSQYLWLGGGSKKLICFTMKVTPGEKISMTVESHKSSEARGIELYIGSISDATKIGDSFMPTTLDTHIWEEGWSLPEGATTNEDGTVDMIVYNTSGCHIYNITLGDGDAPAVEDAKNVAYVGSADDMALNLFDPSVVAATTVDAVPTLEALQENFDALVVSPSATAEQLAAVKDIVAFFPVVNTNPALYSLYDVVTAEGEDLTITDATNAIFDEKESIEHTGAIMAVALSGYFENDQVLATSGSNAAIHVHNAGRNAYYYIPLAADEGNQDMYDVLSNAIVAASKTKKPVTAVGKPNITFKQEDGKSIVTITAANAQTIYYTTDGSTPDLKSPVYTGPFELTQETFVRAIAIGDGFTMSDGVSVQVTIAQKAATPIIAVAREAGKSTVTLSTTTAGVDIYYNFAGQSTTTASVKYSEPFEVTTPATLTVFAGAADGILTSETAQQFIGVDGIDNKNIRWDVIGHFDANEEWKGKGQQTDDNGNIINANYFFTWGKNAGKYWDETSEQVQKVDDEGNPATDDDGNPVMTYTKALEASTFEAGGWILKSIGQVMTWESLNIGWNIGDTSMRNPDTAEDAIGVNDEQGITANALTFGKQPSDGPFNASLETTGKYQGPFDVVVYAGNGNEGEIPTMQIETSTDGETWTKLGDVAFSLIKRNWKKTQLSFEGTDEVYVRLLHTKAKSGAQIYDIYILNNGEKSKAYSEEAVGISNVKPVVAAGKAIYNLNGVRQQSLKRGLNIIVENGKARKVMVK